MIFTLKKIIIFKHYLMLKRLVIISVVLSVYKTVAQSHRFKHINSEQGLSTNYVTSIIQDSKGFMWFGTQEGLCRYDGYQISIYKGELGKANSLSSSYIKSLFQHSDGNIYVGTQNDGLNIFIPYKDEFVRIPVKGENNKTLTDFQINCFCKESDNEIWIGTSNGFNLFNTKTLTNKKYFFPLEKPVEVKAILKVNNFLLLVTIEGLWKMDKAGSLSKVEIVNNSEVKNLPETKILNNIIEYAGNLYLATHGNGVLMLDKESLEVEKVFKGSEEDRNFNYIEDLMIKNNTLYCNTRDGFLLFNLIKGSFERLVKNERDPSSLSDDYLTSIYIDNQKNIWLGTFSGGVNVSFEQSLKFPNFPRSISEQFENAFSMCEFDSETILIGGEKYIKSLNKNTFEIKDYSFLIEESNYVLSLLKHDNTLWVGTWGLGLIKYDLTAKKKEKLLNETLGGTVMALTYDNAGNLWVGTIGDGLFVISVDGKVNRYSMENGLPSDNIVAIYYDKNNNIWLGTSGGGACKIVNGDVTNKGNIIVYESNEKPGKILSSTVYSILEDKNGDMWFGTDAGFCKLNKTTEKFTAYTEKDGISNNTVYSLLPDSAGNFWMSTNRGLTKFNPNTVNHNGNAFKNYDQKDGLLNLEFISSSYSKLSSGEMIFGGVNGINLFHPKNILNNFHVPPVRVVAYKRSGNDVPTDTVITYKKHLKLSWRENYFQFELAALDYNAPNKNKYMYKLEGYDNEWSSPTNIRYVSYTELPGGDYVFKVKAANNDGVWNETPYCIYITVVPPFWKTTWFYILVSVFGAAGVIVFTQLRTRAIKKENKILEHKVAERTKELEEKNRDITSSIEYANRIQEAILPSKNEIFSKFKDAFILYKPKDIVSGDFYWFGYKNNHKIFAVVDCTGHGVPGAFMSMIGHNILNQVVMEKSITDPGQILNKLHAGVQKALKQGHNEIDTNDGMDVSVISVNDLTGEVFWAAAFRPAIIVKSGGELEKLSGNRYSVGGAQFDGERIFTTRHLKLSKGDLIYLFSDGYADQFGGDNGKKFMLKRFQDLLVDIHLYSMVEQQKALDNALIEWKGNREQVDDVLVVGIRF